MKITIAVGQDGSAHVKAIDLKGDVWRDYLQYLAEARQAEGASDERGKNRALRSALANLFAHLDGVVSGLHKRLRQRSDFVAHQPPSGRFCSLKNKIDDIQNYTTSYSSTGLTALELQLKPLRDILMHPSITKQDTDPATRQQVKLSEADVFDLAVPDLDGCGQQIDKWLSQVCRIHNYSRFHDTRGICREWARALGEMQHEPREI
jgi:hypothetical protein